MDSIKEVVDNIHSGFLAPIHSEVMKLADMGKENPDEERIMLNFSIGDPQLDILYFPHAKSDDKKNPQILIEFCTSGDGFVGNQYGGSLAELLNALTTALLSD